MNIIFSTLIAIIIILLFVILAVILATWLDGKEKVKLVKTVIDKVSSLINSKIAVALDEHKAGPWYLVVYTKDSNYPIWISHNTIRSIHPDPKNYRIIIKMFDREDMVIVNVENYEMCAANDLCDYDM